MGKRVKLPTETKWPEGRIACWCGHFRCLHSIRRTDPPTRCYVDGCDCKQYVQRPHPVKPHTVGSPNYLTEWDAHLRGECDGPCQHCEQEERRTLDAYGLKPTKPQKARRVQK